MSTHYGNATFAHSHYKYSYKFYRYLVAMQPLQILGKRLSELSHVRAIKNT